VNAHAIRPDALDDAVDWFVRLGSGTANEADRQAWRQWLQADPEHERAWRLTQRLGDKFAALDTEAARAVLQRSRTRPRRRALLGLAVAAAAGGAGWRGWQAAAQAGWMADYRTGLRALPGLRLADGTRLALNAGTALDVRFDDAARVLVLHAGEILVETAPDPTGRDRPFVVRTRQGSITALGTRFLVSLRDDDSRVEVWQGAVALRPRGRGGDAPALVVRAGESGVMTTGDARPGPAADEARSAAWTRGMLVADDMPLPDFLKALAPHRRGRLDCAADAAALRISGAFPLDDTDRALAAMARALPVRVDGLTRYWLTVRLR